MCHQERCAQPAVTLADRPCDGRAMRGSSTRAVRAKRTMHLVRLGRVSAGQRHCVVRDRIELSTFRFSEGLSPFCPTVPEADNQPSSSAFPLAEDATFPETAMILQVSPYAGECRFVRVTLVLIFARAPDLCCLCVTSAGRSSPGQLPRLRPGPACRARPEDRPRQPPK